MSANNQQINDSDPPPFPVDLTWDALMGRNNNEPAKKTWPELVGLPAEEAARKIKEDMEGATTPIIPSGAFVTMEFCTRRVRLYVDTDGKVVRAPRIG
ncbi:hypothetical protein QQ045_004112 [Rhodiola kirilowii]